MPSLQELQSPIDSAIVNSMIESTPETWSQITLTLVRESNSSGVGNFTHELSSPEGHAPVGPAESLFEATYQLDELFHTHGERLFTKAIYRANAVGDGWSYHAEFEYA
jgi:hypothetical protein